MARLGAVMYGTDQEMGSSGVAACSPRGCENLDALEPVQMLELKPHVKRGKNADRGDARLHGV